LSFTGCGGGGSSSGSNPYNEDIADFGEGVTPTVLSSSAAELQGVLEGLTAGNYVVNLSDSGTISDGDGNLAGINLQTSGAVISLRGGGATLTFDSVGALFAVGNGAKLILRDITLTGDPIADNSGVNVGNYLVMESGAVITGFSNNGVEVYYDSDFTMNGGEIHSNNGGGVEVVGGSFTMNGGSIHNNTANYGAGVYAVGGSFIMNGGEIYSNTATVDEYDGGGGVQIYNEGASFEKTGGVIYGSNGGAKANTATAGDGWGHAILVLGGTYPYRDNTVGADEILKISLDENGDVIPESVVGDWND
jgi:hypothetical protein